MSAQQRALLSDLRRLFEANPADVVKEGDAMLAELFALGEQTTARHLLGFFEDDSEREELMWSILHGIETLPGPAYAAELLAGVATLWAASPEWAEIVFLRALRDPDTFRALGDQVLGLARAEFTGYS